jgi:hypothetical protein
MQKKSRVEQIAQFGDIFRTAVFDPLPGLIQARGIESQFVDGTVRILLPVSADVGRER